MNTTLLVLLVLFVLSSILSLAIFVKCIYKFGMLRAEKIVMDLWNEELHRPLSEVTMESYEQPWITRNNVYDSVVGAIHKAVK